MVGNMHKFEMIGKKVKLAGKSRHGGQGSVRVCTAEVRSWGAKISTLGACLETSAGLGRELMG